MYLFILSMLILLAIILGVAAILGKERSKRLSLSEAWKFVFACVLMIWFVISIVRHRRSEKA